MKTRKGFTLIELIVVVTIIAVLTVVAVVNYAGTSKKSRDSRRAADIQKVAIALEMYRQQIGVYPPDTNSLITNKFLQAWPTDPKSGCSYYYVRSVGSSYDYTLDAQMEDVGATTGSYSTNCGASPTCKTCNYRVVNP